MSRRDDQTLIRDMIGAAETAIRALGEHDIVALGADVILGLGLVKCLEIVGEAASRLSQDFRKKHPTIPWVSIIGMRNRLVHVYFDIDYEQVWKALKNELPTLLAQLKALLPPEPENKP